MDPEAILHERNEYAPGIEDLTRARDAIRTAYYDYVTHVSKSSMAIALETATYAYWLCGQVGAESVIDYGSGFTSYVLRKYAEDVPWSVQVVSVDDNYDWLGHTADFLKRYDQDPTGLTLWTDDLDLPEFDVSVYDFGAGGFREQWMGYALARTRIACVFDDAMHDGHRAKMEETSSVAGFGCCSLELWTRDEFNRYAALAFR